ncbi:Pyrrolidone-carboxylate peptidase [Serratia fonticola]|uniref:Pyrrolidone-carboxylate peptidase n=1 Tax=Serratia fonticola TaxID=47917 RepID=A0A448SFQ1_SERFO|nr:Pyrrolidone-carboxylate peptidase [Serratia fonticola]
MQKVLITGFEPFGGERVNPSWEVVKQLNDLELGGAHIIARQLPCVFGEALTVLNAAIDEVQPAMVLAIGQAGGVPTSRWSASLLTSMMRVFPIIRDSSRSTRPLWQMARRPISAPCRSRRW